jgi:excisionase family DNA binding protein
MSETVESKAKKNGGKDTESNARLLSLQRAAQYMGLSYWTIRDLVDTGKIPTVRIPCPRSRDGRMIRRVLIDRQDLDKMIEQFKECEVW